MHSARHGRLDSQAAIVAGQCNRAVRRAVIGAVARQNFVPPGVEARDLDGVLVGFRTAQGKESLLEIARRDLGQPFAQQGADIRGVARMHEAHFPCLLLDGLDHLRVLVADVGIHQLG